jgi:two-component system phosphate regulon response regulator PhoB
MDNTLSQPVLKVHKVLLVEDEKVVREAIEVALHNEGFEVTTIGDGQVAMDIISRLGTTHSRSSFDLLILDLVLPKVSGLDICLFLRSQGNPTPILVVSAKSTETDIVMGLEMGADDYLTKPFGMRELIARCRVLLRSCSTRLAASPITEFGDVSLDLLEYRVFVRGTEIKLEFYLLEFFMKHPYKSWSREELIISFSKVFDDSNLEHSLSSPLARESWSGIRESAATQSHN